MGVNPYNTGIGVNSEDVRLGKELVQVGQRLYSLKVSSDRAHCLSEVGEPMRPGMRYVDICAPTNGLHLERPEAVLFWRGQTRHQLQPCIPGIRIAGSSSYRLVGRLPQKSLRTGGARQIGPPIPSP